jgi:hypothetical protein
LDADHNLGSSVQARTAASSRLPSQAASGINHRDCIATDDEPILAMALALFHVSSAPSCLREQKARAGPDRQLLLRKRRLGECCECEKNKPGGINQVGITER